MTSEINFISFGPIAQLRSVEYLKGRVKLAQHSPGKNSKYLQIKLLKIEDMIIRICFFPPIHYQLFNSNWVTPK